MSSLCSPTRVHWCLSRQRPAQDDDRLLADWTGSGSNLRIFGLNGHHDLTWTTGSTGAVTGTVRYDPAGVATSVTGLVPAFRSQSSWADEVTRLSWVVTRWYAPAQGRFISEDSLTGEPRDPDSRHLYAYGAGDPVGAWDPDGRRPTQFWVSWRSKPRSVDAEVRRTLQNSVNLVCLMAGAMISPFSWSLLAGGFCVYDIPLIIPAEPVKPGETPAVEDQACGTSVSGRLIQTSAGTGLASGGPLTNRSGCAA